ncbi:MAG: MalY/PatB family protein [Gemella sp.]|nr:MalY/PatB family protein [Gemella sp.]
MTKYDFTTLPNRLNQDSVKWKSNGENPDLLQLWIADMDFLPQPDIKNAIVEYANSHVFGYSYPSDDLFQSIINWEKSVHDYEVEKEHITLIEGVVPAISIAIQAYTKENDAVIINTPAYPPFARTIKLNNRKLVENSLVKKENKFEIDFEKLEEQIRDNEVKLYILCSPHNPTGRVWTREELEKIVALCKKYNVLLVSDEIHQDLTIFGNKHLTFNLVDPSFNDRTIVLASATKTFNIAGTKNSFVIIENKELREAFKKVQLANNHHEIPQIGLVATKAALEHGKEWLDELRVVIEENTNYVIDYLEKNTDIVVNRNEATYLLWLDFSKYDLSHSEIQKKILEEAKLVLNDGLFFGRDGKKYARLNVATPLEVVKEACDRLAKAFAK